MDEKFTNDTVLEMYVWDESWVPEKYHGAYDSVPKDELDRNSWWYLHGKIEKLVGYDKAYTTNCKSAGYSRETVNWSCIRGNNEVSELHDDGRLTRWEMYVNGIIPVRIKGVNELCVGYFWTIDYSPIIYENAKYPHWQQRGLVCLESDEEARDYARKCMQEEKHFL